MIYKSQASRTGLPLKASSAQQGGAARATPNSRLSQLSDLAAEYSDQTLVASLTAGLVAQRVVKAISNPRTGRWEYYSDRDPERKRYPTPEEARAAEEALDEPLPMETFGSDNRPPTFFTYADKYPTNIVGNVRQGPHVVGYAAVDTAFDKSEKYFSTIFDEQVPEPDFVYKYAAREIGKPLMANKVIAAQVERFYMDYLEMYNQVVEWLKDEAANADALTHGIKWLMNTDPRASTNWKTRLSVGKSYRVPDSKIGGKGETDDITDMANVDMKSADAGVAMELWKTRKMMLEDEESSE